MFSCNACNFETSSKYNLVRHNQTKKHFDNFKSQEQNKKINCRYCGKYFQSAGGSYYKHTKKCSSDPEIDQETDLEINHEIDFEVESLLESGIGVELESELESDTKIKNLEHQLEIERMKSSFQRALTSKELDHLTEKHELQLEIMSKNNMSNPDQFNQQNIFCGNPPQFINKKDTLNMQFGNVIDIETFTNNYKNGYGLTFDESKILLENCQMSGIKSCAPNLSCFLKRSYTRQYRAIYGRDPEPEEIILPFILNDSGVRRHFEKTIEGWLSTTSIDNIQKFIVISNDQVFNAHQQFIPISAYEKITISNAILRMNNFDRIIPDQKALTQDTPRQDISAQNKTKELKLI